MIEHMILSSNLLNNCIAKNEDGLSSIFKAKPAKYEVVTTNLKFLVHLLHEQASFYRLRHLCNTSEEPNKKIFMSVTIS